MPLIKVKQLVYDNPSAYAPATKVALVNTDHIVSVMTLVTRRSEPCVQIAMLNGNPIECIGTPEDLYKQAHPKTESKESP